MDADKLSPLTKLRVLVEAIDKNDTPEHNQQIDIIKQTLTAITRYTMARHEATQSIYDHEPHYVIQALNRSMSVSHNNMANNMQRTNQLWTKVIGTPNGPFPEGDYMISYDRSRMADVAGLLVLEAQNKPKGKELPKSSETHMDAVQESLPWKGLDPRLLPDNVFKQPSGIQFE